MKEEICVAIILGVCKEKEESKEAAADGGGGGGEDRIKHPGKGRKQKHDAKFESEWRLLRR